jgi:23S rRNA (uracil1939-C5)-methyltransferase
VVESLAHIGGLTDVVVHPAIASPLRTGYRNKMEFTCTDRPWRLHPADIAQQDGFALGLHVSGTFDRVINIHQCCLQPALGNAILGSVRALIGRSNVPVYGLKSHKGFWRFVVLRHSAATNRWMVNLITAAEDRPLVQSLADRLMTDYPDIVAAVNNVTARKAAIAVGEQEIALSPCTVIHDRIGGLWFEVSANSFFQTNTAAAGHLYETVKRFARPSGPKTVVDLYCGTGTIALCLAAEARQVLGIEINAAAVANAHRNAVRNGITNCIFHQDDVFNGLSRLSAAPDVLIIDPPRAGMHKDVVCRVRDLAPPAIVYVSCNPATLARDLALLRDKYRVCEVQPVDMFPHTPHIEAVARLERH